MKTLKNTLVETTNESGYPLYPSGEDIYSKSKKLANVDPEEKTQTKLPNEDEENRVNNEKNIYNNESGNDLDVPGSELDDKDENIGSEDEENNYYSLGGDEHNNLDENTGI